MEGRRNPQNGGCAGKTHGPRLTFPPPRAEKKFKIGKVFDVANTPCVLNEQIAEDSGAIPYVTASSRNNSVATRIDWPHEQCVPGNTLLIGGKTFVVTFQEEDFVSNDSHNLTLRLKGAKGNRQIYLFLSTCVQSQLGHQYSWGDSVSFKKIQKNEITLPVLSPESDEIDFDYMEARIRELEEARIRELEAYLMAAGFKDCNLTEEEQAALDGFAAKSFKPFKIGGLYGKCELRNKPFDKRKDTATAPSNEFPVPLANAKHGDNGVMFYGRDSIFPSEEMTLDIVQNGAIATGDVYPQPQKTGVLWDAYLIKAIGHTDTERTLCYMAAAVEKAIKVRYNYDKKATWERVKGESIILPVDDSDAPDLSFMETFIRAQMKEAVRGVWAWRGHEIAVTQRVASAPAARPEGSPHLEERQSADYSGICIAPTYSKAAQNPGAETAP